VSYNVCITSLPQARDVLARLGDWVARRVGDGQPVHLTVSQEKRTPAQNRHIHPVVGRLAVILGRPVDKASLDELRWLLKEQWRTETKRPAKYVRSLDGLRMVDVSNRTSDLDKSDASEFIDWMLAQEALCSAA
jgi:hypothetical protein